MEMQGGAGLQRMHSTKKTARWWAGCNLLFSKGGVGVDAVSTDQY
jgi:hypothetical protein